MLEIDIKLLEIDRKMLEKCYKMGRFFDVFCFGCTWRSFCSRCAPGAFSDRDFRGSCIF